MAKACPIKYRSEESVKNALGISTFRNLTKEKVMEFASMIPYIDKDVAMAIINQFPMFVEFGKTVINCYMERWDIILQNNNESQKAVIHGYQTILDSLAQKMNEEISEADRKAITEDMLRVADKIAEADVRNKHFLENIGTKFLWGGIISLAFVGTLFGINSKLGVEDELPRISDDDEDRAA